MPTFGRQSVTVRKEAKSGSVSGPSPRYLGPVRTHRGGMTQPTVTPYKQLRRPLDDRIAAGVCSGVGRYLGVDPVLIRVAFVVLAVLPGGAALLAYPVMWFLMPEEEPLWRDPAVPADHDALWRDPAVPAD